MDELLVEFLTESREGLDKLDVDFITLEHNPADASTIASVFRTIHTIKGTCGFLGFANLEHLTHAGETLLANLRDAHFSLDDELTSALLAMGDAVRQILDHIEAHGNDAAGDYSPLHAHLQGLNNARLAHSSVTDTSLTSQSPEAKHSTTANTSQPDDEMVEVVHEFLAESLDGLECMAGEIVSLEASPDDRSIIISLFRTVHTIKGTCSFLGYDKLERVTHAAETLLTTMRDAGLKASPAICRGLADVVRACQDMLVSIGSVGHDGANRHDALVVNLEQLRRRHEPDTAEGSTPILSPANVVSDVRDGTLTPGESPPSAAASPTVASNTAAQLDRSEMSIRVDVPLLDSLMNLVGELVLARNQILEHAVRIDDTVLNAASQRLSVITSELQDGVMRTRMQPIQSVWAKLPRLARDVARTCGKQVRVEMAGKETELDKSLIEAMKDPMTHLIRNCVDHGIEPPEARAAAGKPTEGVVQLRAYHESGQVHIEVRDDGAGISPAKLRERVVDKGLMSSAQVSQLSDADACKLIFLPGLSTADAITNISGRGVGMDVVKTNIDDISGIIDVESVPGAGTVFRIRIPLTLAIVPALIVEAGAEQFAIPQVDLLELIRLGPDERASAFEYIQDHPVFRLRGNLLPIVFLTEQLELEARTDGALNIVVLQANDTRFGLVVDHISETQEIVVKPLSQVLQTVTVFAGATIMGDGRVALIVDVPALNSCA